jgi:hypothetical protein
MNVARMKLATFSKVKVHYRMRQAMERWKRSIEFEDFMLRINAQLTRVTALQYKTSLFYAWRNVTTFIKKRKFNVKVRVWACLVKNRLHNRVDHHSIQLALHYIEIRRK